MTDRWRTSFRAAALCAVACAICSSHGRSQAQPPAPRIESLPAPPIAAPLLPGAIDLETLGQIALGNHPAIRKAALDAQAAQGRAVQAGLYPNPQIAVSSPQIAGDESQFNVFANQDIVTGGKLRLDRAAALRETQQAQLALVRARFEVLTALRQQFYFTLATQRRTEVLAELLTIAARSNDIGQQLLRGGEGTRGDSLLLGIELDKAQVGLENAQLQLANGKRRLAVLVASPYLEIGWLQGDLRAELPSFELEPLQQAVIASNSQSGVAQAETARSQLLLRRALVQPIPNVNVMGGYQYQVPEENQNQAIFQVQLAVPLWNKNQGAIRAAQAGVSAAQADVRRVQLELANQAAAALADYRVAQNLADRYERQIVPKAQETLRLTQQLYAQGQGEISFLTLLQSQRALVEANLAAIDAHQQRWAAAANIANLLQVEQFP